MKLIFTPNPDYIHKVLVVAFEAGVHERLTPVATRPFNDDTTVWEYNPLGKVPCLMLDDGQALFGGMVICEYLDSLSTTGRSVYPRGEKRWPTLRQAMLGEGMFDATTLIRVEGWRAPEKWHRDYMLRERRKVLNALDAMEREAPSFAAEPFHIGHICMAGAISYLELRNPIREHGLEPADTEFDWRTGRPLLSKWYDKIRERPSTRYTAKPS